MSSSCENIRKNLDSMGLDHVLYSVYQVGAMSALSFSMAYFGGKAVVELINS